MSRSDNPREGDIPKCWLFLCNLLFCSGLSSGKPLLICPSETPSVYTVKWSATSRVQVMAMDESHGSWNISISFVMKRPLLRALKETWLCYPMILMWAECEVCMQMTPLFGCQMVKWSLVYLGHQCVQVKTVFVYHNKKKALICHPRVREKVVNVPRTVALEPDRTDSKPASLTYYFLCPEAQLLCLPELHFPPIFANQRTNILASGLLLG